MTTRGRTAGAAAQAGWLLAGGALAWLAGVALQLAQPWLWAWPWYGACVGTGVLCAVLAWRGRMLALLLVPVGMAALGLGTAGLHASVRMADALAPALEGRDLQVVGVVASLPQQPASGLRYRLRIESATQDGQPVEVPALVSLGWYTGFGEDTALSPLQQQLRAGQRWRFTVRLQRPHGNLNPHGFDYELQLFERGVRATGYVRDASAPVLLDRAAGVPIERLRQSVRDAIYAAVDDTRAAGVLAALSMGDQSAIVVAVNKPASTLPSEEPFRAERG